MKKNNHFEKFLELKSKYKDNPTKAQKEEVENEVRKLILNGWATPSLKVVFDFGIEKYRTMGLNSQSIKVYDKDKSIRVILRQTYGEFLPKGAIDLIQGKELIFNPHKPTSFNEDGIDYANLFLKSKFFSFNPTGQRIDAIEWDKYRNIKALFENVFKTQDRMNYFINWVAYSFQTLNKTGTAIVSKGIQGTGKGVIFEEIIKYAIGERYVTTLDNEALKSRFNGELENKMFVLANEIKADFREGNTVYERLKMYITDPTIRMEEKNIKARSIPNFFNIWFHSNNDVPLQIQGNDRRYTVFNTKSKQLREVSNELGYEHISDYIEAIRKERDNFIYDVMSLKYIKSLATTPLSTEEKELIYEASMSKMDVLSDKLKKKDIGYFDDAVGDFYNSDELEKVMGKLRRMNLETKEDLIRELNTQLNGNYIKNDLSNILYKIFVNENETDRKIGLQFNKHFGKATHKFLSGKTIRYRKVDSDKVVGFDNKTSKEIVKELKETGNLIYEEVATNSQR